MHPAWRRVFTIVVALILLTASLPLSAHGGEEHGGLWWGLVLLGRLHVLTVHFPIALIVVIGLIEAWRWWRRDPAPNSLLMPLTLLTAALSVVVVSMGWLQASTMAVEGAQAELLAVHRWTGTITALVAVGMAITRWRLDHQGTTGRLVAHRLVVIVGVVLVSIAGHFGGLLVHGVDYLSSALPGSTTTPASSPASGHAMAREASSATPESPGTSPSREPAPTGGQSAERFATAIAPMLGVTCLECHGPTKQKGDLRIDSRAALLTGGASGPAITPGRGDDSLLIQRLRGLGGDPRMPKKKDPLSDATISQIAQWIDDGAPWPDSVRIAAP